jgi:hypothetical protein
MPSLMAVQTGLRGPMRAAGEVWYYRSKPFSEGSKVYIRQAHPELSFRLIAANINVSHVITD